MNKKAQQSTSLQAIFKGGVPLAFVLFGLGLVGYSLFGGDVGHFIFGFISAMVGAYLYHTSGSS